ncbi:AAA family ATPase [Cellulomonas aerilata]|uniref:Nuclease SbcCD subunit C n=1 Tax=Cellulomonas aerilata TaxID=515326 RepID=A0A512D7G3_9CELL|nr:SMC family ATPase [Cellulomonas aerilata]GEO32409.1 nuclease SbcCD subunit C [Cellulomonas aerilata]
MHLRTMTLQALGPFAGTHTVDFAELGASGLYLLEGPTGAGKSTIIDAVVFALYGKVASAATSDDRLRSGYAPDDVDTVVDLVFETGSGVYRVRRTPERQRAKKRGTGTTRQNATIKLWRLASADDVDGGELLSTRLDEAGPEIQRAIGLDRAQFVQTIVLPQGEFASFLRADPEQRRGLLQKVFGTEVYERVQERLVAMRREAQASVDSARSAVAVAAAHFVGAASVTDEPAFAEGRARAAADPDDGPRGPSPAPLATASELRSLGEAADPDLLPAATAHVVALTHEAEADAERDGAARAVLADARAELDDARALAGTVRRRDALRAEQQQLRSAADVHAEGVARRDLARRAAVLASVLTGADTAQRSADEARRAVERLRGEEPDLAGLDGDALGRLRESLAVEAGRLRAVAQVERTLPRRRTELATQEAAMGAAMAERAALTAELAARPVLRAELVDLMDLLGDPGAELASGRTALAAAQERHDAARRAETLDEQLDAARSRALDALEAARHAVRTEADLRGRRLAGMAGELALGLVPGDACPVCGSPEHPDPAALAEDHPDDEQVAAAEAARARAETWSAEAGAAVAVLVERAAAQRVLAGGSRPELEALVAEIEARVTLAEAAQRELLATRQRLQVHDAESDVLLDRARGLDVAVARGQATIEASVTALEADDKEVDAARVGAPTVAARLAEIEAHATSVTALARALTSAAAAEDDLRTRLGELHRGLAEHGFADAGAARAALLGAAELGALERSLGAFEAAVARVEAGLAEPAVAALPDDVVVDVAAAQAACEQAEGLAAAASRQATLSARCASAATDGLQEVTRALGTFTAARDAAAPVTRIADLASASGGDNALRLTLATYVLARRFEDVVAAANDRLAGMSDGRFELVRSEEREDVSSRKRGLAMKVLDHRIEAERDPRTLSGGETFYVSLCLALGMADVVTAEAGGIDVGTLFVDEGFGTLDPETLEAVLTELGKLRAGGRVVGVVSHVEALKQSIAERIEVRRLPDGSSTLTVRAG